MHGSAMHSQHVFHFFPDPIFCFSDFLFFIFFHIFICAIFYPIFHDIFLARDFFPEIFFSGGVFYKNRFFCFLSKPMPCDRKCVAIATFLKESSISLLGDIFEKSIFYKNSILDITHHLRGATEFSLGQWKSAYSTLYFYWVKPWKTQNLKIWTPLCWPLNLYKRVLGPSKNHETHIDL